MKIAKNKNSCFKKNLHQQKNLTCIKKLCTSKKICTSKNKFVKNNFHTSHKKNKIAKTTHEVIHTKMNNLFYHHDKKVPFLEGGDFRYWLFLQFLQKFIRRFMENAFSEMNYKANNGDFF